MRNYQTIVVFAPMSDICWDDWQEHVNKKYFNCGGLVALKELKKICLNIQTTTIEKLCDKFNRNRTLDFTYMKLNWFGVIYVEM
jgi:hypothetical protein